MKKIIISGFLLSAVLFVFAHAPRTVNLTYNNTDNTLQIEAIHEVRNVERHYIDEIKIYVNGAEKKIVTFEWQSDSEKEEYSYKIGNLKKGDIVKVDVSCNRIGSKSAELKIE